MSVEDYLKSRGWEEVPLQVGTDTPETLLLVLSDTLKDDIRERLLETSNLDVHPVVAQLPGAVLGSPWQMAENDGTYVYYEFLEGQLKKIQQVIDGVKITRRKHSQQKKASQYVEHGTVSWTKKGTWWRKAEKKRRTDKED